MTGKKIKVLLLEDEAAHAEAIRRGLESSDIAFQLQVVGTLKKYREHIAANLPDIALVDMVLPDGNGIDLLTSPPELNAFPILILTSHGDEKAAVEVLKAGALDYIVKSPETFSQMSRILSHNLKQWSLIRENKQAVQALQASETNFRNSMENSPLGTRIVSEDGETLYTNRAFLEIYGYRSLAEFNAAPVKDRYTPDSYVEFRERRDKRRRKEPLPDNYEVSIVRKNGDIRHLRVMRKEILWAGKQQYQTIYRDITGQKQAEEALKLSEERWKTVVGHAPVGIATLGQDGHIINANEAFCRILGYTEKELQQLTCKDLTHSEDVAESDRLMQKLLSGEESSFSQEKRYIKKDGTVITGKVIVNMIRDANGNPQLGISELEDITAQKKMELALRQSEQNFRNSIDSSPMGIYIITSAWDTLYANQAFLDIFGYKSIKEVIENPPYTYYTPESHALLLKRREAQKHGAAIPGKLDVSIQRKDGTIRYLHISRKQVIWNGAHQYQLFYDDITTGKQAQQTSIASEVSYRRLFESAKDGILIIDAVTGLITDANPFLNNLLGLSLKEIKGKELWEIGTFADIVSSKERFEELRQKGYMRYEDLPLKTADGRQISVEFVSNVYDVDHRRVIQCNIRDITERKNADAALRTSEGKYRLIVEKSKDVIFTFNAAGEFIYISPAIKNGLGYDPSELIGHTFSSLIHPEDVPLLQQAIQRNVKDGSQSPGGNEYRIRHASGEWRWHNASGNAVYDDNGKFVNFVGVARDITERKQIAMKLDDLHRTMRLVTEINQLIVKIDDEKELLQQACNQLIRSREYPLAWIGFKQEGSYSILPFVQCGEKADYLTAVNITWDDSKFGQGPTGVAIRTGKPDVMMDMAHDPRYEPWREQALQHGFKSSVAIPLTIQGKVIGAVTIYSVSKESFGSDELELLVELSGDLSVGVEKIRRRAAQLKLEEELKLSEQNFRNSMDNALFGIRIVDINSETLYANRALLDIFGYRDFEEIKSKPPKKFFTPESYQAFVTRQNKWSRGESNIGKYEVDIIRKDGAVRHLNVFTKDVFWNGKPELQIYYQDVTEMKQAEEILKTSEQNLHTALDKLPVGCRITDVNDNTLYLNQEFLVIFGYANAEEVALKPPLKDFYTPESYASYLVRTEKMLRNEPREDPVEVDIIRKDGSPRRLQLFHTNLIWNGKTEFQTIYRDITETVQAETALKLSEQNFRNSIDRSTIGIRIVDTGWHTLYANHVFLDIFGYKTVDEIGVVKPRELYTDREYALFLARREKRHRGELVSDDIETEIIRKDGAVRYVRSSTNDVLWNGRPAYQLSCIDVTQRVRAEEARNLSEQNFHNSLDGSLIGIRIVDADGRNLYLNQTFLNFFGYENAAEVETSPPQAHYTPECYAEYLRRGKRVDFGEPIPDAYEIDIIRKDGAVRNLQLFRKQVLWNGKQEWQILYNDITDRVQAEKAKKLSEQNFRNSLDSSLIGIRIVDADGRNLYLNKSFLNFFGYENAAEVETSPPQAHYTPECYAEYLRRGKRVELGEPISDANEVDVIRKDGAVRHLQLFRKQVLWNGKQEWQILYTDITDRVEAEKALKLSEQNFRNSMDGSTLGLRIMGDADQTLYANQAMLDIFGYRNIQELKDNPPQKYYTPEYRAFFEERKAKFARGEALPERLEFDIIRNDGAVRHLQLASAQVLWNGKQQYQIIYTDITDRVEAEKALKLSEQNFRNTLDSSLMGIFIGHSGKVLYVNKAFLEMFGYDNIAEVTATRPVKFYSPESYALYLQHEEKQKHGEPEEDKFQIDIVRKDGSRRHLEAYRQEVLWDNKLRSQIIYNDVTSLKLAEEERQRLEDKAQVASRLAVVGEMAAGVAHEINNPLTGVLGFSQMLLEKENVPEEIKAELRLIVDGSQRVADIVKRLLTFARQTKPVKTMTNINELIDNTLKLREYVLKTVNINVVTRFDPELPWSVADPGQLQQVFLNLIVNAEQAMKTAHGRGTLTVTTEKKGNDIFLSFQDDGPGIKFEDLKRLFEPFFTTKAPGEGTGLGLSLSRSIILEHNGSMRVESEFGRGANFIIELPIIESLPSEAAVLMPPVQKKPAETKHGKILVVDDEPGVRILLERVFIQMGHQVDTVADAETAVNKLDAGSTYDIILTDVRMPGMSGIELHTHILEKSPAMKNKIIFITGDVMGADIKEFLVKNNLTYFAKPFDIEALKAKINRLMLSLPLSNDSA